MKFSHPVFLTLFALFISLLVNPVSANSAQYEQALQSYENGNLGDSVTTFQTMLRNDPSNRILNFNLAKAHEDSEDIAEAVYYYYRALRLDPAFEEAQNNLSLIEPIENRVDENTTSFIFSRFFIRSSPVLWVGFFQICVIATLVMMIISAKKIGRNHDRMPAILMIGGMLFMTVISAALIEVHRHMGELGVDAIVMQETIARQGAGEKFFESITLDPGTGVRFAEAPDEGWVKVKIMNGTTGYIPVESIRPL